ncbi:MAG TPA: S53 family peptidase [Candidatus Saccharimonadales bacterium]|nr:S53 family peptidase [Candidatus Saccharimonadales bacterium]
MKKIQTVVLSVITVLGLTGVGASVMAKSSTPNQYHPKLLKGSRLGVCNKPVTSAMHCFAKVVSNQSNTPDVTSGPTGYSPTQFHTAYQLPATSAHPATIAVVAAYDNPNIVNDLALYNQTFGLPSFPLCKGTVTTSCFLKVNQNGGTSYPSRNSGWALEIALDVQTAHQICQNCKLILVEASSSSYTNLMKAVDRARLLGANIISNSYGSNEFSSESTFDSHFNYPGIAFIFSSGDSGFVNSYPASSPNVISVGGTTLNIDTQNHWLSETVWSDGGSGCSRYELKPTFQTDTPCTHRTNTDVSADADPNTGAAIYDSYGYSGYRGWFQVGGTSLAAPLIAGIYGLANNFENLNQPVTYTYNNQNYGVNLHDITTGQNGGCGMYLCQGTVGYDGPTGLGSPLGLTAF